MTTSPPKTSFSTPTVPLRGSRRLGGRILCRILICATTFVVLACSCGVWPLSEWNEIVLIADDLCFLIAMVALWRKV